MAIVAIGTEIRRRDLLNLTWERIDFQRGLIDVPNSKTGRDYSVPMNENVKAVLREIRNTTRGNGYVFINPILPSLTPTLRQRSGRLVS
jgi:integrase